MDADDSEIDYRSLHEFRYSIRRFIHFSEEAARAAGFEPQQQQLMLAVKGMPEGMEPTIGNLAERLQLRHHSCVELIDRLVASGHAVRHRNEADRREVLVQLTPSGEAHLRDLTLHHQAELRAAGPALARVLQLVVEGGGAKKTSAAAHELALETAGSAQ
ncbi:MAG: MarR family transcriptional regulator [Anaerolineaceae bacterium]